MTRERAAAMEANAAGNRCRVSGGRPELWQLAYEDFRNGYTQYGEFPLPALPVVEKIIPLKPLAPFPPLDNGFGRDRRF